MKKTAIILFSILQIVGCNSSTRSSDNLSKNSTIQNIESSETKIQDGWENYEYKGAYMIVPNQLKRIKVDNIEGSSILFKEFSYFTLQDAQLGIGVTHIFNHFATNSSYSIDKAISNTLDKFEKVKHFRFKKSNEKIINNGKIIEGKLNNGSIEINSYSIATKQNDILHEIFIVYDPNNETSKITAEKIINSIKL